MSLRRYIRAMMWSDVFDTNLERLRRYATLATGDTANADEAIATALQRLLTNGISPASASLRGAFLGVDEVLRDAGQSVIPFSAGKSRWYRLTNLERRLILLVEMEGFSLHDAARITGLTFPDMTTTFASARMKYADRFPARICLFGEDSEDAAQLTEAITRLGHEVVWTTNDLAGAESGFQNNPTVVMVMDQGKTSEAIETARQLGNLFEGAVIVATQNPNKTDVDSHMKIVPWPSNALSPEFRRGFTQALLFMK